VGSPIRVVVDTNVVLRGLLNVRSRSGRVLEAVERRLVLLLLSKPVVAEYRAVLTDAEVVRRFAELTPERVDMALRRLRFLGEYLRSVRTRFALARDPRDAMLIELAIAGRATDLVTGDDDLLSLPDGHDDAAKRLRQRMPMLRVMTPADFLNAHASELRTE